VKFGGRRALLSPRVSPVLDDFFENPAISRLRYTEYTIKNRTRYDFSRTGIGPIKSAHIGNLSGARELGRSVGIL